jgi:hypothetical protein
MPSEWRIETHGLPEAKRVAEQAAAFMLDLRPFWPRVSTLFISWMRQQFQSEGGFGGSKWAPLSPLYAQFKARVYPGKPILQATGAMRRAASSPTRLATATTLTLRIEDDKIEYHETGTTRMPARPLLFDRLPMIAERELQGAAEQYVDEIVRRIGG